MEHYNLHLLNWILGSIAVSGICRAGVNYYRTKSYLKRVRQKRHDSWHKNVLRQLFDRGIAMRRTDGDGSLFLPTPLDQLPNGLYKLGFTEDQAVCHIVQQYNFLKENLHDY